MTNNTSDIVSQLEIVIEKLHYQKRNEAYNVLNMTIDKLFLLFEEISNKETAVVKITDINKYLVQCLEAMEKQDDILMADILEYEIIPRLLELGDSI